MDIVEAIKSIEKELEVLTKKLSDLRATENVIAYIGIHSKVCELNRKKEILEKYL